jgi:hypothetical protein
MIAIIETGFQLFNKFSKSEVLKAIIYMNHKEEPGMTNVGKL